MYRVHCASARPRTTHHVFNLHTNELMRANGVQPAGESRRNYLAVIALLGIAFGALPNLFEFEFQLKVVPHLLNVGDVTSLQTISLIEGILTFLISPCLFFVVLYLYGRGRAPSFRENYLGAIVTLFLGSALGYAIYTFTLLPLFGGEVGALNYLFWLEFAFGLVSGGLQSVLAGVAALGVSYLRAERSSESGMVQNLQ